MTAGKYRHYIIPWRVPVEMKLYYCTKVTKEMVEIFMGALNSKPRFTLRKNDQKNILMTLKVVMMLCEHAGFNIDKLISVERLPGGKLRAEFDE